MDGYFGHPGIAKVDQDLAIFNCSSMDRVGVVVGEASTQSSGSLERDAGSYRPPIWTVGRFE
jgi:hypothetical protein